MIGARSKINAISLNVKINKQKSVDVRGYKLPINVHNFMQKDLSPSENIVESCRGSGATFFDSPCRLWIQTIQCR